VTATAISNDPFVKNLLAKVRAESRDTFSDAQLIALKEAAGGRQWGAHAIAVRHSLKFLHWHYYFVFVAGRNRRDMARREEALAQVLGVTAAAIMLLVPSLLGYLLLSRLGIWDVFQEMLR
jgi:hypothetical protein